MQFHLSADWTHLYNIKSLMYISMIYVVIISNENCVKRISHDQVIISYFLRMSSFHLLFKFCNSSATNSTTSTQYNQSTYQHLFECTPSSSKSTFHGGSLPVLHTLELCTYYEQLTKCFSFSSMYVVMWTNKHAFNCCPIA